MNSELDKVHIVLDIARKLKYYEGLNGQIVDLYRDSFPFIKKWKKISNDYIHGNESFNGKIYFDEIGRTVEFFLPIVKDQRPMFVIRNSKKMT